jgi:hypothetical protein
MRSGSQPFQRPELDSAAVRPHQSTNGRRKWRRRRAALVGQSFSYLGTAVLALLLVQAFIVVVIGKPWTYVPLDNRCQVNSVSCGILSGIAVPLLSIAFASATFLFFRLSRVQKRYRQKASRRPRDLVPTAGRILERVVGRDELCYVITDYLRDRQTRRAFVIVGGVGAGKTAVLVQLTRLLADAEAIPVPVKLRDAQSESALDFAQLAKNAFLAEVAGSLLYEGEGERAWRQLVKDEKIVVLADGLEEALIDNDQRNSIIRVAIQRANRRKLPLVIASRPHDPLRTMPAAIVELEPLSEEAALSYVSADGRAGRGQERLNWIVETAEVTEEPLYLQITRELHKNGLLEYVPPGSGRAALDARDAGRTRLRLHLLDTWTSALTEGFFPEGLAMSRQDRRAAVESAAALACIGLKLDSVHVKFTDLLGPPQHAGTTSGGDTGNGSTLAAHDAPHGNTGSDALPGSARRWDIELRPLERQSPHPSVIDLVAHRLSELKPDIQVAAAWAEQLELIEMEGNGVRFPHSIIQAYLGSLMMSAALDDQGYCREAFQKPGREFLISVVMYFCSAGAGDLALTRQNSQAVNGRRASLWADKVSRILNLLLQSAKVQDVAAKKLDIYAAALEIDSANGGLKHQEIANNICRDWPLTTMTYDRPLEEAKLRLVRRFGEAVRKITKLAREAATAEPAASSGQQVDPNRHVPAYQQLYQIGVNEKSYPPRLAIAIEIGAGGKQAYECLREKLSSVQQDLGERAERMAGPSGEQAQWREEVLSAWLAPLLAASVPRRRDSSSRDGEGALKPAVDLPLQSSDNAGEQQADGNPPYTATSPESILTGWMSGLRQEAAQRGNAPLPVSLEIALAQGFKYAANRRRHHPGPGGRAQTRAWLADQATEALKRSRFWFTHLTLLHALCLLTLRDDEDAEPAPGAPGSQPEATVSQWLAIAGSEAANGRRADAGARHPFVAEAGGLVVLALREQRPDKYIWIDESGVTSIIGSHGEGRRTASKHNLWIPPSTGWSVLDPRAQRLVADVLLLLNLAERGDRPEDHDRRLGFTNHPHLPPCLTHDRSFLNPLRPARTPTACAPGSNCRDDCSFRLCPYPAFGGPSYRVELSEPFCRNQQAQLPRFGQAPAPWQQMRAADLKKSWGLMAERSRGASRPQEIGQKAR